MYFSESSKDAFEEAFKEGPKQVELLRKEFNSLLKEEGLPPLTPSEYNNRMLKFMDEKWEGKGSAKQLIKLMEQSGQSVSLVSNYDKYVQTQTFGTCHIFAIAHLFQASCKRYAGVDVDVSEAYLFYRHLREFFEGKDYYDGLSGNKTDSLDGSGEAEAATSDEQLINTIERIMNGSLMSEEEFPFDFEFETWLMGLFEQQRSRIQPDLNLGEKLLCKMTGDGRRISNQESIVEAEFPELVRTELDKQFIIKHKKFKSTACSSHGLNTLCSDMDPQRSLSGGYFASTGNTTLRKCLEAGITPKYHKMGLSASEMVNLLNDGHSLLCANRRYKNLNGKELGGHAFNIVGYRKDPLTGQTDFQIIEPNTGYPQWHPHIKNCDFAAHFKALK